MICKLYNSKTKECFITKRPCLYEKGDTDLCQAEYPTIDDLYKEYNKAKTPLELNEKLEIYIKKKIKECKNGGIMAIGYIIAMNEIIDFLEKEKEND